VKVKVNAAVCEGFGNCATHAPDVFDLDEWGYAEAVGDGSVPEGQEQAARRAIADCPVHAIVQIEG
jgi:ferredoxin